MANDNDEKEARAKQIRRTAHDVRTPLTSIAGFAELIAEDAASTETIRANAVIISQEADRLAKMLDEHFEFLREAVGEAHSD